jgi:lipopolysaccharide export system protein LptC
MTALAHDPPSTPWQNPAPWYLRAIDTASTYLPLLLMAVLALGTWWLVKNTPLFEGDRAAAPLRHEPDYTMTQFMVQRFGANGAMRVQIEGDLMRHYPDTDTFEIDNPRIRAIGDDGRVTTATARLALSNRDGSEVQLTGGGAREGPPPPQHKTPRARRPGRPPPPRQSRQRSTFAASSCTTSNSPSACARTCRWS